MSAPATEYSYTLLTETMPLFIHYLNGNVVIREVDGDVLGEYTYSDTGLVGEGTVPEEYKTQIGDFLIAYMPILAGRTT
jgi:hypothetical protein